MHAFLFADADSVTQYTNDQRSSFSLLQTQLRLILERNELLFPPKYTVKHKEGRQKREVLLLDRKGEKL
jgi:hypothetical protein